MAEKWRNETGRRGILDSDRGGTAFERDERTKARRVAPVVRSRGVAGITATTGALGFPSFRVRVFSRSFLSSRPSPRVLPLARRRFSRERRGLKTLMQIAINPPPARPASFPGVVRRPGRRCPDNLTQHKAPVFRRTVIALIGRRVSRVIGGLSSEVCDAPCDVMRRENERDSPVTAARAKVGLTCSRKVYRVLCKCPAGGRAGGLTAGRTGWRRRLRCKAQSGSISAGI